MKISGFWYVILVVNYIVYVLLLWPVLSLSMSLLLFLNDE